MKINVLIFPAGEVNSVELHTALSHNVNIKVFGASSVERHGSFVFKNYRGGLPFINENNFIQEFNELIQEWNIDCIFPTHDTVALFMAEHEKQINAKIITSDLETALVCRDKKRIYELFREYNFCPEVFTNFTKFPCFIKPREGQGAVGTKLVKNYEDIPKSINGDEYVICEYLPGEEITVDCITDFVGDLKAILPRKRLRTLAGICVRGEKCDSSNEINEIAQTINSKLKFLGLWYFQLKRDSEGTYKLLEISTRCAGTMCLSRARGVNLPLLSVYAALGKEITVFENPYEIKMDRTLISRYKIDCEYETIYIDYDDTIIEENKVCLPVICFLYQCKNMQKQIVLITRHEEIFDDSIEDNLKRHSISESLFDKIIKLSFKERKSDYIVPDKAIFIDNAYLERKQVHDKFNIPVFDVEGIEVLADWTF